MSHYEVIGSSDLECLEVEVNKALTDGYKCVGGISVSYTIISFSTRSVNNRADINSGCIDESITYYYQAMIKETNK